MSVKNKRREPAEITIDSLSHDGRLFLFLSHRAQVETIPEKNPETEVLEEAHCKNLMPTSKKKENNIIIAYRCTW